MKIYLLLLFFVLPGTMIAQAWRPVNSSEKFNFRIDTAGIISNVIVVDSVNLLGGDSVYYLNRVVRKCTGCPAPGYYLCHQPQFLLKEMIMQPGGTCIFKNPGSFLLKTLAAVNESWVFDTVAALTAQVTSKSALQVFGQWDSVKTISLSNGQLIKLSKDHGILQFPVIGQNYIYHLEGIAGRNVGTLLPGFMDMYNFQVGDVFQYKSEWMSFAMGYGGTTLIKNKILSRDSTQGGYNYLAQQCEMYWDQSSSGIPGPVHHQYQIITINYTDSATNKLNHFPGQLVMNPLGSGYPEYFVSYMTVSADTGLTVSRIAGNFENGLFSYDGTDTLSPIQGSVFSDEYTTGLGAVYLVNNGFESYDYAKLIGYVKNGDTTGVIYPDEFLLQDIPVHNGSGNVTVFPNPAKNMIYISIAEKDVKYVLIELYGTGGQVVRRIDEPEPAETVNFDITDVVPGLYLLMIKTPGGVMSRKIVIE